MPRLSDVVPNQRVHIESLDCPEFKDPAFVNSRPLNECKVALVSSAGLIKRHDDNVRGGATDYRSFKDTTRDRDLLINHVSVNFDRSGFSEDPNTVFPRELLRELAAEKVIGAAATEHYSFMGASEPAQMEEHVNELVVQLHEKNVTTVCLLPV